MTDPDLTPEQEAVRRLLADARHDGPTPPEVVARLDRALASLVAEQSDPSPAEDRTPAVVDLGARRRRTVGIGLLAAAAVVVAGVGLGQVLPGGSGTSNDAGGSASSADDGGAERQFSEQSDDDPASGGSSDSQLAPEAQKSVAPLASTPTLSATDPSLEDELLSARSTLASRSEDTGAAEAYATCDLPRLGKGRQVAAQVDGQPGLVLFRRPDGAAQQVELYVCGTTDPVRTLTLPAP